MKTRITPIERNEKSTNVNLLHKALAALGMPVSEKEASAREAGNSTLQQVRALQTRLDLPVDDSLLLNEETAAAITAALRERGLMDTTRSFTVSGTVRLLNGALKKRQRLLAYSLDLRGVAVFNRLTDFAEIQRSASFEFLGETTSDNLGRYSLTFYAWQLGEVERGKANVVVYAVDGERIIGHSGVVNSEEYAEKILKRQLDVIISVEDERTEYEILSQDLNALLQNSKTSMAEISASRDQRIFTAGELDVELSRIEITASSELLTQGERDRLSPELLYGLGREGLELSWPALFKKTEDELRQAIARSVEAGVIREHKQKDVQTFLDELHKAGARHMLDEDADGEPNRLNTILSNALPKEKQRIDFLTALSNFEGQDFRQFWTEHLPSQPGFKNQPKLVAGLLFTQQLTLLTGNHQPLVTELQKNRKMTSVDKLFELERGDWLEVVEKSGVPDFIQGETEAEKADRYLNLMQSLLDSAFPTLRIAQMIARDELPIENTSVSKSVRSFLSKSEQFDFASSRLHDFKDEIQAIAGDDYAAVNLELKKIQRVFQVSPNPGAMRVLVDNNLHSAYSIANTPRKSFIKTYGEALGGEHMALAVHQRASYISSRAEMSAMHLLEYSHGLLPQAIMDVSGYEGAMQVIKANMPNPTPSYMELFGSPDICECEHCRSVYSAAAYLVDLLRFLWRSEPNADSNTPLDLLAARRPDLLHLPLTCENTNTLIPYIDLVNEVMEYYTVHGSLINYEGHDTGDATVKELRASPQHLNIEAYRKLKDAVYPFNLPYHQPLDVIRTYSENLKVKRQDVLKAINPQADAVTARAIEAESLGLSQEEYLILTGEAFDGSADATPLHAYFGCAALTDLEGLREVPTLLERSGLAYTDLVELVKTQFINPHQGTLDFLERVFSHSALDANTIYTKLEQIAAGTLDPANDSDISAALSGYNNTTSDTISMAQFTQWVNDHFGEFQQVITIFEPESKCALETTWLRTIRSIYEEFPVSGIQVETWSKMHRFIRLWRKLDWSMLELDLVLTALGEDDITPETIRKLASVLALQTATKRQLNQLAVLWGNIDTDGKKSLYQKLFLNKAVAQINEAFLVDSWGDYLQDPTIVLGDHRSTIIAAFRIREEDLEAILQVAEVIDGGAPRKLDINDDALSLPNLSAIYRYVVFAKALKMSVADVCKLIALFDGTPFSRWDIQQGAFTDISPLATEAFYKLAASTKSAGFKSSVLEYILQGTLPADSTIGLEVDKTLLVGKSIRDAFSVIEQNHTQTPPAPLTVEIVTAKLSLTFQAEIVSRFMAMIEGSVRFETITDSNLNLIIPEDLADKFTYIEGSGRLVCVGMMSEADRDTLKALPNANASFQAAVDELFAAPEFFISENFEGVFSDQAEAMAILLDRPPQAEAASLDARLAYVYTRFLPLLKSKLRKDAITQQVAALIGLSEESTALLIADVVDDLVADLSIEGFSATYFSDAAWGTAVLERTDSAVDFSWGVEAPDPLVPSDSFSARWKAYIAAPASGEYTVVVDVEESDEIFKLYLDEAVILEKSTASTDTSLEAVVDLNAASLHLLTLEYAEDKQHAGIRLRWKTASTAREIIFGAVAYPASILDDFATQATLWHRAAKFILGFEISETELDHLISFAPDFGGIDFRALDASHWKRVRDYMTLRNSVPQAQAWLTDVFRLANMQDPAPTIDDLSELLHLATAWDEKSLAYLIDIHFALGSDDFKNEIALNRLHEIMRVVSKTGISAAAVARWGTAETIFDDLHATARLLRETVRAKYQEEDWLTLAGSLSDSIRENQKQALISHLLMQPAVHTWGARDADGLFEYLLIDVQMASCMETSRIVQANAAVQMFVNRCLLNLESDSSSGDETGVPPEAIDKDRWEWMKNYRVWEANRKVFLYPENWLEPEWRMDRSDFFRDLESYLVQNDVSERSAEQAFRFYLANLNEVANLEVCGMYQEDYEDGELKLLHVFARTHNAPYKYYYRIWNEFGKWSAWKKVEVDVRSVEEGDSSGVDLIPVVWKNRLFIFWPEFIKVEDSPTENSTDNTRNAADYPMSHLGSKQRWEIRLAWSEYVDDKWSPKKVSKEFLCSSKYDNVQDYTFRSNIRSTAPYNLTITLHDGGDNPMGGFYLSDIQSKVRAGFILGHKFGSQIADQSTIEASTIEAGYVGDSLQIEVDVRHEVAEPHRIPGSLESFPVVYRNDFMKRRKPNACLELLDDTYLKKKTSHMLLNANNTPRPDKTLDYPFFFSDAYRSYFVRPIDIRLIFGIRNPADHRFFIPQRHESAEYIDLQFGTGGTVKLDASSPYIAGRKMIAQETSSDVTQPARLTPTTRRALDLPTGRAVVRSGELSISDALPMRQEVEASRVGAAFGTAVDAAHMTVLQPKVWGGLWDKGLEFHTFYHPYSSDFVTRLNKGGLSVLMESDTAIPSDGADPFFENEYKPNFIQGLVQKPDDFERRTYYKENVCFDAYGANSIYNWELFFHSVVFMATRLSKNGRYEEAMKWYHLIFDPTTDEAPIPGEEASRYWKVLPFKTTPAERLEDWFRSLSPSTDPSTENMIISEWRDNPFDPHLVASNRPIAYMKNVVIKYVENLIAWGDSLFRQFTRESVNEALQLYVIANHILGARPQFVPRRGEIKAETYSSLQDKWDDFSNALVELENIFPYSSAIPTSATSTGTNLLGIGPALYFCIPSNDKLMEHWDRAADRLFKIRHCQDISGVERQLALFAPPIDPGALIHAMSQGLSLGSILADLSSPPPIYRFSYLLQKANEFCGDVKSLGSTLLAALEKKDAEELGRLRASHETQMLTRMTAIRERNCLEADANVDNLKKARLMAERKLQHYIDLLGRDPMSIPATPEIGENLTAESQLPGEVTIGDIDLGLTVSTSESDYKEGLLLISQEESEIDFTQEAKGDLMANLAAEVVAGYMGLIPQFGAKAEPLGVGADTGFGGRELGWFAGSIAKMFGTNAQMKSHSATKSARIATYIRRAQDWNFQANQAKLEIYQLDRQITSAKIRKQVVKKELDNHLEQIEEAKDVERFLKDKFTNQELYMWMREQIMGVYKQSYNLAFDLAKKAEKAYKYELGTEIASFIQYGYWDNAKQGLAAGDKLQLALRQLENSYLEENRRELELNKSFSLALLDPLALIQLKETGKCYLSLPEEIFDLDFQNHYFRRIKAVSLSIPCVIGPYTTVNCSLRLLKNDIRINTSMNGEGNYEHENDEGLWIDDDRFRTSNVPVTSIATSTGQNDDGMFEFNFRDERYLPFEGAGAISEWQIELSTEKELRQFEYSTITDVILHLNFTARESGGLFKEKVVAYIKDFIMNAAELSEQPLMRMFSMRYEFPSEWHKFLYPAEDAEQVLGFTMGMERFPFFVQDRLVVVMRMDVFAKCTQDGEYKMLLSYTNHDDDTITSSEVTMPENPTYGGLNKVTLNVNDAGLNLEELNVDGEMSLKLKFGPSTDYASLATDPSEVEDILLVVHYKLDDN